MECDKQPSGNMGQKRVIARHCLGNMCPVLDQKKHFTRVLNTRILAMKRGDGATLNAKYWTHTDCKITRNICARFQKLGEGAGAIFKLSHRDKI